MHTDSDTGFKPKLVKLVVKNSNRRETLLMFVTKALSKIYDSDGISLVINYFALPEATASLQSGVQVYL